MFVTHYSLDMKCIFFDGRCVCACVRVCTVCVYSVCVYAVCANVRMCACVCVCVCKYLCLCVYIYTCTCVHACIHVHDVCDPPPPLFPSHLISDYTISWGILKVTWKRSQFLTFITMTTRKQPWSAAREVITETIHNDVHVYTSHVE